MNPPARGCRRPTSGPDDSSADPARRSTDPPTSPTTPRRAGATASEDSLAAAERALADALTLAAPPGTTGPDVVPELLRHGSHAVFAVGPVVARVGPDDARATDEAHRALAVARALADLGFPAVRAVPDGELAVPQPISVSGRPVTFWRSLGDRPRHGSTGDLGRLLRRFHALDLPATLRPAVLDPVGRITRQLASASRLSDVDRNFLATRLADLAAGYADRPPLLPTGHLHGDATVANVVLDPAGRPTLIDLDLLRTGPRDWDLVRTAVYARRLGWHTASEYRELCDAYGADVAAAPGFDVLADLTELLQVAWLADAANDRPQLTDELTARIATLRNGTDRRSWRRV
jgi:aminoglycoside phosphotransferase (APT) family kinase protein